MNLFNLGRGGRPLVGVQRRRARQALRGPGALSRVLTCQAAMGATVEGVTVEATLGRGDRVATAILGEPYEGTIELAGPLGAGVRTDDGRLRYLPNGELSS